MSKQLLKSVSLDNVLKGIVSRPKQIILAVAVVTFVLGSQIPKLSIRTSIYDLVIEDIPETSRYHDFKQLFGSDEIIRVVVKGKNVFDPATSQKIEQLADGAAEIKGVRRVISLPGIKKRMDATGKWSLSEFATVIRPVALFKKNLLSTDHKATVLTLILEDTAGRDTVIRDVREMISGVGTNLALYQIGMPLVSQALATYTEKDFFRLPPITFLLIAVILFVLFRNFACILLPLTCVILSLVWTFGLMGLTNVALSMLTMIVPIFLIAVGTAYCLHIGSEYLTTAQQAESPKDAAILTFSNISFPTAIAVFTTVIGLGSLLVNRIVAIREFAIFSCFGMLSLLVLVLTLFPAALAIIPLPKRKDTDSTGTVHLFDRFLDWIVRLDLYQQKFTLPILGVLVAVCIVGIFRIKVETSPIEFFKEDTPVSRHFHDIYQDLSGSFPINVVMVSEEEDYFEDAAHLADIARLQEFLETLPGVDKAVSFAEYMKLVNFASNQFDPKYYALPEEDFEVRMLMNSYKIMLGDDMFSRFMNAEFSKANILLFTHISSSGDFLETRDEILAHVRESFSKDLAWDVTGLGMVVSASSHLLTKGQVKSLSLTIVLVFGIMFVLFLSVKVGLIAILPNLFPIIINFGMMGWLGIELSMATSLIASIAIGLAVDDTIHYLVRYNREFKKNLDDELALKETIKHVGRPIVFTTLTIGVGFSILTLSSFKPTAIFGVMMVITMFSALVADLILLPSLMLHVELVTLWDLVRVRLGKDPQEGISLFEGLSRTEVHYILMAGTLREFEAGEVLFRKGDPSDFMYAILSGELDVVDVASESDADQATFVQKLIRRLKTGDLVGEMGLLRFAPRSATVIAAGAGELLQINWKMMKRLQWLMPPTAHRFFYNLITIICDRLESATHRLVDQSVVDDLTGLCNTKGFLETLDKEVHRAKRYNTDLSICLIGINFEAVNPYSTYDANDRILSYLGGAFSAKIRRSDTLGRIDTQRFALLLPYTSVPAAEQICERLWHPLDREFFEAAGIRITVTLGLAGLGDKADETGDDLLVKATEALESAMEGGHCQLLPVDESE